MRNAGHVSALEPMPTIMWGLSMPGLTRWPVSPWWPVVTARCLKVVGEKPPKRSRRPHRGQQLRPQIFPAFPRQNLAKRRLKKCWKRQKTPAFRRKDRARKNLLERDQKWGQRTCNAPPASWCSEMRSGCGDICGGVLPEMGAILRGRNRTVIARVNLFSYRYCRVAGAFFLVRLLLLLLLLLTGL